jgi:carbamoyltransferase
LGAEREPNPQDSQRGSFLGPEFSNEEIGTLLDQLGLPFERFPEEDDLIGAAVQLIASGKVIGWFQGRMEFGPRALGARSILADPRVPDMQLIVNQKIKHREGFRPFAPAVLKERVTEYFDVPEDFESPYMLFVAPVHPRHRSELSEEQRKVMETAQDFRDRLRVPRSSIPAVTHVDYSARIQTVDPVRHGRFYRLLKKFEEVTGCGVLLNTSFNVRGEPIVCTPADAIRCFLVTNLDGLVIGDYLVAKDHLAYQLDSQMVEEYLAAFEPD